MLFLNNVILLKTKKKVMTFSNRNIFHIVYLKIITKISKFFPQRCYFPLSVLQNCYKYIPKQILKSFIEASPSAYETLGSIYIPKLTELPNYKITQFPQRKT